MRVGESWEEEWDKSAWAKAKLIERFYTRWVYRQFAKALRRDMHGAN
jgi:hypothetical protein